MIERTTKFFLVITIMCYSASFAANAPQLEDKVRELELKNGLKIVVVERHSTPVFFSLISFRVGSTIEEIGRSGLSHFMEHMLFKGSQKLGTTNYKKEIPLMAELEETGTLMRNLQVGIQPWRFKMFEEYATEVKQNLTPEQREEFGSDEASTWKTVSKILPHNSADLPQEWQNSPWVIKDDDTNYWEDYQMVIELRSKIAELLTEQREYIFQTELDAVYDENGAKMLNAGTSYDMTMYMVGLPSNCLDLWVFMESDRFKNPVFREFYSEREIVQEELLGRLNSPRGVLFASMMQTAFVAHPYGRPIIGWREDLKLTLRSEMEDHFRKFYAPNNCQITIVGDVDTDEVFKLMKKNFSSWKAGEVAHQVTVIEPEQIGEKRMAVEFKSEPSMMIGYHIPAAPHPDNYALQIMDMVLTSGRTSRLYKSIYEEGQLTGRPPYTYLGPGDRYAGLFLFGASPNSNHSVEEVELAIYAEIEKLKTELVSDNELQRMHNKHQNWQLQRMRSNQWLAFTLSGSFLDRGNWRAVIDDYDRLMKVTPDDIQRVANKYFKKKNRTVAFIVKPETEIIEEVQQ